MTHSGTKILINNLRGIYSEGEGFYIPREEALEILRKTSGHDFGDDTDMWEKFFDGKLDKSYYEPKPTDGDGTS